MFIFLLSIFFLLLTIKFKSKWQQQEKPLRKAQKRDKLNPFQGIRVPGNRDFFYFLVSRGDAEQTKKKVKYYSASLREILFSTLS